MTFKEFIRLSEAGAAGGGDNGLMGYPVPSEIRKPSDGIAFKDKLGCVAGQTPRGPSGGGGGAMGGAPGGAMGGAPPGGGGFMKKRMKKK